MLIRKMIVLGSLFLTASAFGATICVDIPDAQIPYIQAVATRENAESVQAYLQNIVTSAVNSWQKQQEDEKLQGMKNTLQALSPTAQAELIATLQAKAIAEGVAP